MNIKQRVMTPLGPGTIVHFEAFSEDGTEILLTEEDPGVGRVAVQLDDPQAWTPTVGTPHPYIFRSQLSLLEE